MGVQLPLPAPPVLTYFVIFKNALHAHESGKSTSSVQIRYSAHRYLFE